MTSDTGGAANAAYRLHNSLLNNGIDSKILCLHKHKEDNKIVRYRLSLKEYLVRFLSKRNIMYHSLSDVRRRISGYGGSYEIYSAPYSYTDILKSKELLEADIVHLHWVCGFVDYPSFFKQINKPIVWTIHDMNPFLGGFHYQKDQENNKVFDQLEQELIADKANYLSAVKNMTIVSPSVWIKTKAEQSSILSKFEHVHCPNCIDTNIFKLYDKNQLRTQFGIPQGKLFLLFVSENIQNKRKGFAYLLDALKRLDSDRIVLGVIGNSDIELSFPNVIHFGYITDDQKMATIYACADLFVIPSLEDNLPNTMIESLACGTPVVGFETGGIPEFVINYKTGLLAKELSGSALSATLSEALNNIAIFNRSEISNFVSDRLSFDRIAAIYKSIYLKTNK